MSNTVIRLKAVYRFVGNGQPGGLYRTLDWARDGISLGERVIYCGLDGADEGHLFCCSLWDFGIKFRLVEESRVPEPLPLPAKTGPDYSGLLRMAQEAADADGVDYLAVSRPKPSREGRRSLAYVVRADQADDWERANAVGTLRPVKGVKS